MRALVGKSFTIGRGVAYYSVLGRAIHAAVGRECDNFTVNSFSSATGTGWTSSIRTFASSSDDESLFPDDRLAGTHQSPVVKQLWSGRVDGDKERKKHGREEAVLDSTASDVSPVAPREAHHAEYVQVGEFKRLVSARTPEDSYRQVHYAFASDPVLRDAYANPWGFVRHGRFLEDLDALAGSVAVGHADNAIEERVLNEGSAPPRLQLVTASVEKIRVLHRANLKDDMVLSGKVIWVGKSSMDIAVNVTSSWADEPWLEALFCFVARDPITERAMKINRLLLQTEKEEDDYARAEKRNVQAKKARLADLDYARGQGAGGAGASSLLLWPSAKCVAEARKLLQRSRPRLEMPSLRHAMDVREEKYSQWESNSSSSHRRRAPSSIFMSDTKLSNALICQRQNRNPTGRVFGGFIMRRAFELAFASAYLFAGRQPRFLKVDKVEFKLPVDVGDLLRFESCVLFTEDRVASIETSTASQHTDIHVEVLAFVTRPESISSALCNKFNLAFSVGEEDEQHSHPPNILPATAEEAYRIVVQMRAAGILCDEETSPATSNS